MDAISLDVANLSTAERHVFEGLLGHPLRSDQRVVVQLVDSLQSAADAARASHVAQRSQKNGAGPSKDVAALPDWCAVFADLSDEEYSEIEKAILTRANFSRSINLGD